MVDAAILGFFTPGPLEIAIIAGIFLLLFSKRLPGMMRSIGSSIVQFKKGISEVDEDAENLNSDSGENKGGGTADSKSEV